MYTKKENPKFKNQKSKLLTHAKRVDLLIFAFCTLIFAFVGTAFGADLVIAEKLLVDLRAEDLPYGSGITTWQNRGTLGNFTAFGTPVVENVAGLKCVTFDGSSWFEGPTSVPGIEGAGTRSIEVWAYNPSIPAEETMVSWSHRGGPDGTNMSFNYGNNGSYGAVGHWGAPDMGWWGTHSPAPAANTWWHLTYTYDGTTVRLYVNGVEESVRTSLTLNTHAGNIIRVGAQANTAGTGATFLFTGSIAEVRIHDGVLKPADIMNNFSLGGPKKAHTPSPANGAEGVITPLIQWSAGLTAKYHDVYFGTNPTPGAAEYRGRQALNFNMYWHLPGLTAGLTYYWRIDEVEADEVTIHIGDVWSFTAATLTAYKPNPADGAKYVSTDAKLSWTAGTTATSHDVYFGTVEADVTNGTGGTSKGNQKTTTFDPGPLQLGTTYYWRVDEVEQGGKKYQGNVWRFSTIPVINVTDPNLVGWWKFDEGQGTTAIDWSGKGNHGTILGGTAWVEGYDGGALRLKGTDGYVTLPIGSLISSLNNATFTTWVNFTNLGGAWQRIFDFGSGTSTYIFLCPRTGTDGPMRVAITTSGGGGESMINASATLPTGWHHVAVVIRPGSMQIYLDGGLAASGSTAVIPSQLGQTSSNWLGRSQYPADAFFNGTLDDFRIYNYAMSPTDIPKTMRGDPLRAWNPKPADKAITDIDRALPLTWSPGEKAAQHDVYFGTDQTAVDNATTATTGIYRGRQAAASYTPPEGLQWGGGPYYWRIDEYNTDGTISTGRVWSFTVADYLIVDDFESYTDDVGSRIFQTWKDGLGYTEPPPGYLGNGTGSMVGNAQTPYAEQAIVHSGSKQSMPLGYDNSGTVPGRARYSETFREWTSAQDWTRYNVKALTLYLYGAVANAAEQLYVALEDNAGHIKVVNHPDPPVVREPTWHEWNIELTQFSAAGVNPKAIKRMYIGLGKRTSPTTGGTGTIYIDDIRLHPSRCVPSKAKPAADIAEPYNCKVGYEDLDLLTSNWLISTYTTQPVDPGNANLVGHWKLDDGSGSIAIDSSVNKNNGTLYGDMLWTDGHIGGALEFDGTGDYVELPIGPLIAQLSNSTFTSWVRFWNAGGAWQRIFDFGNNTTVYMFLTPRLGTTGQMRFGITIGGGGSPEQLVTAPATLAVGWHHVAVTIDADNDTIKLYLDGLVVAQNTRATLSPRDLGATTQNWLGRSQWEADAYYMGLIDDFRIYNRTLSGGEVAALAGLTAPFGEPFDLNLDGVVNFKDFAVLADSWLEQLFWP